MHRDVEHIPDPRESTNTFPPFLDLPALQIIVRTFVLGGMCKRNVCVWRRINSSALFLSYQIAPDRCLIPTLISAGSIRRLACY